MDVGHSSRLSAMPDSYWRIEARTPLGGTQATSYSCAEGANDWGDRSSKRSTLRITGQYDRITGRNHSSLQIQTLDRADREQLVGHDGVLVDVVLALMPVSRSTSQSRLQCSTAVPHCEKVYPRRCVSSTSSELCQRCPKKRRRGHPVVMNKTHVYVPTCETATATGLQVRHRTLLCSAAHRFNTRHP